MEHQINTAWVLDRLPQRPDTGHKGIFGTLTVLAGSLQYRGAALLACGGALRSGVGIVRLASTERICQAAVVALPTCILYPMEENSQGGILAQGIQPLLKEKANAIVAGCGLGLTKDVGQIAAELLEQTACPLVLDADILNVLTKPELAGMPVKESLARLKGKPCIVTPHVGEMARLCGMPIEQVLQNPGQAALGFAADTGCVVVLKSHATVVASAGELYALKYRENAGLAKGGSGDVLAGIIGGLVAQGCPLEVAAGAGVWLHSAAGELAAREKGKTGMLPQELPEYLCAIWQEMGR